MQEVDLPSPGPDERSLAMLAHALQIVGGFIAPLVIFLIRRDSRFVGFHALQALLLQLIYMFFWFILFASLFGGMFVFIARESSRERRPDHKAVAEGTQTQKPTEEKVEDGKSGDQQSSRQDGTNEKQETQEKSKAEPPPVWFFLSFFAFWGLNMIVWLVMFIVAIAYSVKASRGEWTAYPVVGRWARRILA